MALRVEKIVSGAKGLAKENGKNVLLPFALPGEEVEYSIVKSKPSLIEGKVEEVITPSPLRVEPICPLYGVCGGCDFLHVSPSYSALLKEEIVKDNLLRLSNLQSLPPFWKTEYSDEFSYRHRVRVHVDLKTGKSGFLERESNSLVSVKHCPLVDDKINALLEEEKGELFKYARELMFSNKVNRDTGFVEVPLFAGDNAITHNNKTVTITLNGIVYTVSSTVFFQSNPKLFSRLLEYVKVNTIGSTVMDLYSGVGTFSALFNDSDKKVYAVELNKECLALSHINAPKAISFTSDCAKWAQKEKNTCVDTVIVDPPRTGLEKRVIEMIDLWDPERVIYVSCNPVTLARDISLFKTRKIDECKVFDCFYGTSHVETVVLMSRK